VIIFRYTGYGGNTVQSDVSVSVLLRHQGILSIRQRNTACERVRNIVFRIKVCVVLLLSGRIRRNQEVKIELFHFFEKVLDQGGFFSYLDSGQKDPQGCHDTDVYPWKYVTHHLPLGGGDSAIRVREEVFLAF
jgi:hypothetical protein